MFHVHCQDRKEKQAAPVVQLNLIRLLADLSVSVNKWEVVDMILPLFIESLEEGDALAPSSLRLQVMIYFRARGIVHTFFSAFP